MAKNINWSLFWQHCSKVMPVTMNEGLRMNSWFDIEGMKNWTLSDPETLMFNEIHHKVPSTGHTNMGINYAKLYVHDLIKKLIKEGNFLTGENKRSLFITTDRHCEG